MLPNKTCVVIFRNMKKLLLTSVLLLSAVALIRAGSVTLAWNASAGTNVIAFYTVFGVPGTNTVFTANNANATLRLNVKGLIKSRSGSIFRLDTTARWIRSS